MKKFIPYLIILGIVALAILIIASARNNRQRKFDQRVTLRQQHEIPYGTSVAKRLLPELFPEAAIYYDGNHPGFWDSISSSSYNQAVIMVSKDFEAEQFELERLMRFVENGNYVFIAARSFSGDTRRMFRFSYASDFMGEIFADEDSLWMQLNTEYFSTSQDFFYPGKKYDGWFTGIDTSFTHVLGRDRYGRTNFIRIDKGSGSIFFHAAPLVFSNYFILHKHNYEYFEKSLSVIPANLNSVLWNEYYLNKQPPADNEKKNWLAVLFRYESFRWGLLTAILALVLYVVLGSRRRQRMIPLYAKPRNESLDFVKTMGRLYHEKRDHKDLAWKMGVYFLEHVRSTYKLSTQELNQDFISNLHVKSGYPEDKLGSIVNFIHRLNFVDHVSEDDLAKFHGQLELFYQNT
jgi:hypothetical protein